MPKMNFGKLAGLITLVGVIGWLGYFRLAHRGPGDDQRPSLADHERVRQPAHRARQAQDTDFMTQSGSVDREKLRRLLVNVDASTFEDLCRRILACPMNDEDKCNFLWSLTMRMVNAGEAELARKMFAEIKPTGELRRKLLMAIFQDSTKPVASLIEDQRKLTYDDEAKAALAGITEKMRGEDFNQAELFGLPQLNDRESLAIANGIAMRYGTADGDEAKVMVFKKGMGLIGKLIDAGKLQEHGRTCFLGASSMVVPFETWETLVSLQTKGSDADRQLLKQALGMNVIGLIKMSPEAGMGRVASSLAEGRIDEAVFRTGIRAWIGRDIELATKWIERNTSNQQVADLGYAEMYQRCLSAGDQATAEQWRRLVKNPEAIQGNRSQDGAPANR